MIALGRLKLADGSIYIRILTVVAAPAELTRYSYSFFTLAVFSIHQFG